MVVRRALLKKITLRSIWAVSFVVYVCAVGFLFRYISEHVRNQPVSEVQVPSVVTSVVTPTSTVGVPVRLTIPSIKVNAAVASVGMTADGAMDIKKNPDDVAWYNLGARPGNIGSAVIAGHYGWENGKGSVFNELHTLQPGEEVSVTDERGGKVTFIVRESRRYDPDADASAVFLSNDGKSHLNIITCEGIWNAKQQTYSGRLVVFTDKK